MATVPELKELQARKRALLLESEMNRQTFRVEFETIRFRLDQIQRGYGWAHMVWQWGAPLAGFLFARKFTRTGGAFAKGSFFVKAAGTLWKVWSAVRGKPSAPWTAPDRRT